MAAPRSQAQLATVGAFIEALFEAGGFATWKEFSEEAGVHPVQVSKYKNAESEASGVNLYRLIIAASQRAEETPEGLSLRLARATEFDRLTDLGNRLEALAETVALGFVALGVPEAELQHDGDAPSHTGEGRR